MRAVVATGSGFVAVGQDADDGGARVWRSADGERWTVVADQPALHNGSSPIRMQAVAADAGPGWSQGAGGRMRRTDRR